MAMFLNTNVSAMNAQRNLVEASRAMNTSILRLSTGLRLNQAADDPSGMSIAYDLRTQANSIKQSISNANEAVGMIQIADKAMSEQFKILDTIKVKATQAAQDTQNKQSRGAIQADITRLIEQLDNIAFQTSYNGIKLLSGSFTNKEFEVGAYSNQTIKVTFGSTQSSKIGNTRKETTATLTSSGVTSLTFKNPVGGKDITLESVVISTKAGSGIGVLAEIINKNSDLISVRAHANVITTGNSSIGNGFIEDLVINGVEIGSVYDIVENDVSGNLINSINKYSVETGVNASIDIGGRITLTSRDGRGIEISSGVGGSILNIGNISSSTHRNFGRLTLTSLGGNDIRYSASGVMQNVINSFGSQTSVNLRDAKGVFSSHEAAAAGAFANVNMSATATTIYGAGVTTQTGAMMVMDIAQSAQYLLDKVRSDIGAAQGQLFATINNLMTAEVNIRSAYSGIVEADFGLESSEFTKQSLLVQSGSFVLSQANNAGQTILKLLQNL